MSNEAYEKLHKLVDYLLKHGIMSELQLIELFDMRPSAFKAEFLNEEISSEDQSTSVDPGPGDWLFESE